MKPAPGPFIQTGPVSVPAVARQAHGLLLEQQHKAGDEAEGCYFNSISGEGTWGIVTSGVSYSYVKDAIADLGIEKKVCLLKLGFTHPLPSRLILEFLERVDKVLVVEELEPYLEESAGAGRTKRQTSDHKGKGPGCSAAVVQTSPAQCQVIADYFEIP
jgi:indolepyruvate ferredoxin oxidoreductase alpha subunit